METFSDQFAHDFDGVLKLLTLCAHQGFGLANHVQKPAAVLFPLIRLILRIAAGRQIGALATAYGFIVGQIEHGAAPDRVGLLDGFGVGAGRSSAQRGCGGGGTRSRRAQRSQG